MRTWIKITSGFLVFFGIIFGYTSQAEHLSTYLDLGSLIKTGVFAGAILGLIDGYIFQKSGRDQDSRFSIFAGVLILGVVLGPLILTLLNRYIDSDKSVKTFELIDVKPVMESRFGITEGSTFEPDAHMIRFSDGADTYEIKVTGDVSELSQNENTIQLEVAEGGLGYRYIHELKSTKQYQIAALPDCYKHHQF